MDTFSPPITQSHYQHLLCHSVTGGFASDLCSCRQSDHKAANRWPWQEQPFSCSAKMRKNFCWHGLIRHHIWFGAKETVIFKWSTSISTRLNPQSVHYIFIAFFLCFCFLRSKLLNTTNNARMPESSYNFYTSSLSTLVKPVLFFLVDFVSINRQQFFS